MVWDLNFYKDKKVLLTGHTGFKGSWMCKILEQLGANVVGYALQPTEAPNLYTILGIEKVISSVYGDVRNFDNLFKVFQKEKPEIVIHMAAQPLVRESYNKPKYTYETNVMGTVNICECIRMSDCVKSFLNVTTDKVYKNNEWVWGYRETEPLDGFDPYSNSKSCSELVTHSYINSFFNQLGVAASTARAGNVIGGGDFAENRIIPDCFRAAEKHKDIEVRNLNSVRPYQHVLEPVMAYLMIAQKQYNDNNFAGYFNIGPNETDCITTGELVRMFCDAWGAMSWISKNVGGPHESDFLKLDCSRIKFVYGWKPRWNVSQAVMKSVEWYKAFLDGQDVSSVMEKQIREFLE